MVLAVVGLTVAGCATRSTSSASTATATVSSAEPAFTVYVSDPPTVQRDQGLQDVVDAEQLAWNQIEPHVISSRADFKLVLARGTVSDNARTAIASGGLVAYLGEIENGQSSQTVGILNTLDVLELSPTDTVTPPKVDFEDESTYGRTFASLPIDLGTAPSALSAALPGFSTSFKSTYGHAPAADAIQGYDAVYVLLRVLANLGNQANNRSKIVTETLATLRANRGRASVAAFTITK